MGWLNKIFNGHGKKISKGGNRGKSSEDSVSDDHHESLDVQSESEYGDIDHAIALSLAEEEQKIEKAIGDSHFEEDERLARALQESMSVESPPRQTKSAYQPLPYSPPPANFRICARCKNEIGYRYYPSYMDFAWHPECFRCYACNIPISDNEFCMHGDRPYHSFCYGKNFPKCDVCKNFIPASINGQIEYRVHPFWKQKYCPSHQKDGTPPCCSCERLEPRDTQYVNLGDGRKICMECMNYSIMDNGECNPLYIDIREFFEGLYMKVEQQIPLLLVERQALNEALEGEKNVRIRETMEEHYHLPETRGLCLAEERIVRTILKRPIIGPGNKIIDMITGPQQLIRHCEVTAILILFGLPRLLTGSILAHELMHAWLRLRGYKDLPLEVEEGICQVLAHMWLESEITSGSGINIASTSSSSSSSSSSSKKGVKSEFEKKLGELFKYQIEMDDSPVYGDGFRAANRAVDQFGLKRTLDHISMTGAFPS